MAGKRKRTWREKLHDAPGLPKVGPIDEASSRRWGTGMMVIPHPLEVDGMMRQIPEGKLNTMDRVRDTLARRHGATIACPLTTGIFAWIAAHAAAEGEAAGEQDTSPYWRLLKSGGEINAKYPGGVDAQMALLAMEGHTVAAKGNKYYVLDYEQALVAGEEAIDGSDIGLQQAVEEERANG